MIDNFIKNIICESKSMLSLCKVLIETHSFNCANIMLDAIIYNIINIPCINNEIQNNYKSIKDSYIFFVEGNGYGHTTQMFQIYSLLKDKYKCIGIVIGRRKSEVDKFCKEKNIPILNLQEPEFVSDDSVDKLTKDALKFLVDYSITNYKSVSSFVSVIKPEFIINLHLPIKLFSTITKPVINISSQNRLDFNIDYKDVILHKEFDKYQTDSVLFSSYVIHKSYLKLHKIAIDSLSNKEVLTIPPLIEKEEISSREDKIIVCYFNTNLIITDIIRVFETFKDINFYIYSNFTKNYVNTYNSSNVLFCDFGYKFKIQRKKCIGIICSCGFETICENFQLGLPMLAIPMNPEQLFNAYDHSRKIPGFYWSKSITETDVKKILNFEYTDKYWEKHKDFCKWLDKKESLKNTISTIL